MPLSNLPARLSAQVAVILAFAALLCGPVSAEDVRLRAGDQVDIRLGGVPSEEIAHVSSMYSIDEEGYINLPHIGKIRAAGLTQAQLQSVIENTFKTQQIYTHPTVTVSTTRAARFVNVDGAVRSPRRVEYTPDMTLLSAINAAGGFTDFANVRRVQLMRDGRNEIVDVRAIRRDPEKDVRVRPGDHIHVPQSFF